MSFSDAAPFYPDDRAISAHQLAEKATRLRESSAYLDGLVHPEAQETIGAIMDQVNSYYSNLIEGNSTEPHEIRQALDGDFSADPAKRDMQLESLAYISTQSWLRAQNLSLAEVFSADTVLGIHKHFYDQVPDSLRVIKEEGEDDEFVEAGRFRERGVRVGKHIPIPHGRLGDTLEGFQQEYNRPFLRGDKQLIGIMAAHHRFVWVHPFLDGNGRVGRLLTDEALKASGLGSTQLWCLSRGLARSSAAYKHGLARADFKTQGSSDGRGPLSMQTLSVFCGYMLDQAQDQIDYISGLLDVDGIRRRIEGYIHARRDGRVIECPEPLKPEAGLILHYAFMRGQIERRDALQMSGMGERQSRRLLKQLKDDGLLSETSSRSPLKWELPEHAIPWYFPSLA